MQMIFNLLHSFAYIDLPYHFLGWAGWLILFALLIRGCFYFWKLTSIQKPWSWTLLAGLVLATPVASLYFGARLPAAFVLPMPGLPVSPAQHSVMFLSAIPWVLAAGIFGPVMAAMLAAISGLLLGFFETHTLFTTVELAGLALLFGVAVRQPYRTPFFRFLRQPLGAALALALAYAPVYIMSAFFAAGGPLAVRIDYALTQTWLAILSSGSELLIAGLIAQVVSLSAPQLWTRPFSLQPSPAETNLQLRFFYVAVPLVIVLIFTLMISAWIVAGSAAQKMMRNRLASIADVAAESMPYFFETGQSLVTLVADDDLLGLSAGQANRVLAERLRMAPYFRQFYLFDANGRPVTGHPIVDVEEMRLTAEEIAGIDFALKGVLNQIYTIRPWPGESTVQISFLAAIRSSSGQPGGVLLGRTDLKTTPFTQPIVKALLAMQDIGGEGMILNEDRQIIFHSLANRVMTAYPGRIPEDGTVFFQEMASTGERQMVYYRRVQGFPWTVVLLVPAEQAQTLALEIAIPSLILLLILSLTVFVVMRFALRSVSVSLSTLAHEASLIAHGQLDHPLQVKRVDEVGRFANAFEQMRVSLRDRLEELNRLLMVSQGVASHLEVADAVAPILQASLRNQAASARIVLVREVTLDAHADRLTSYGAGSSSERYAYLDEQLFDAMRSQDLLSIPNLNRMRRLNILPGAAQPGAIIALPLRDENQYYGSFWVAYDSPHTFTEEEVGFLSTLAGQAALAATNALLYATAEIGRQRMEAVLSSTPDAVLVIDEQMKLLLLNPAAMQISGLIRTSTPGSPVRNVVQPEELLDLIMAPLESGLLSKEIKLPNGKVYHASVSMVIAERPVGRICILHDITNYKELDTLKSDFVQTVSHDLRSPLTLMRGYTTMMNLVGELNDQQKGYLKKIVLGVDNMTRLVSNLLDLGRVEAGVGLKIDQVAIGDVIDRVVAALLPQANQKNIRLIQERSAEKSTLQSVSIRADAALLEQAIYNLVENAIKYTNVGGRVTIGVQLRSKTVLFEIRDTGIGIAPLDLPHMFEKFYRSVQRETHQQRGTGLGLAIVKTIAERHGGRVWVESYLGKGSTFYLEIPFEQHMGVIS
ncbi:MAG TPA: ATP-binding protein [Levilinea sp.]|nr:ATP-binding protein [Levilinea sp.]